MPINTKIDINYVVEQRHDVETKNDVQNIDADIEIIDKQAFINLFEQHVASPLITGEKLWNSLLGNADMINGDNPHVHFLTKNSATILIENYQLFLNGIDFQHLPSGFFLIKNGLTNGIRDVLHYSGYLAQELINQTSPLAVTLGSKENQPNFINKFTGEQAKWYDFFIQKATNKGVTLCTPEELEKAFIEFSNTIQLFKLNFYPADFSLLNDEVNPIILLGRFQTVMRNRHLKPEDREIQWQNITRLPLIKSWEAIRGITDYQFTSNPCGFLIHEMGLDSYSSQFEFTGFNNQPSAEGIGSSSITNFWRYISYQPQRHSINFYRTALQVARQYNEISYQDYSKLDEILAAATTRENYVNGGESSDLANWQTIAKLIGTITDCSLTMKAVSTQYPDLTTDVVQHLYRLKEKPNLAILQSISEHIANFLESINPLMVLFDPLKDLRELSDKLDHDLSFHKADFYRGARFYFIANKWQRLNIKAYTELQEELIHHDQLIHHGSKYLAKVLGPHLSTFGFINLQEILKYENLVYTLFDDYQRELLSFCCSVFKDAERPLDKTALDKIFKFVQTNQFAATNYIDALNFLDKEFNPFFSANYFSQRKEQLLDENNKLSAEQLQNLNDYHFESPACVSNIIKIESALIGKYPEISTEQLNGLNELFYKLSQLLGDDFAEFTQRLTNLRLSFSNGEAGFNQFSDLLTLLVEQKSVEGFNQFYLINQYVKVSDTSLIEKNLIFVKDIRTSIINDDYGINPITLQENLATIVLKSELDSVRNPDYLSRIDFLLNAIKLIATHYPQAKRYYVNAFNQLDTTHQCYSKTVVEFAEKMKSLTHLFPAINNDNTLIIFSLLSHYEKKPHDLIKLINVVERYLDEEKQRFIFSYVTNLLDNNRSIKDIKSLIRQISSLNEVSFGLIESCCKNPPYPDISHLQTWLLYSPEQFKKEYQQFTQQPFGNRRLDFTFTLPHYHHQKSKFTGIEKDLFTDELGTSFDTLLKTNRGKTVGELRNEIEALRAQSELTIPEKQQLLCLCIEMLARTAWQYDDKTPPNVISQEFNTTQVMAMYAVLANPNNKLLVQIDTGEGKSRQNMILAACRALQGETVDFITSSMPLAERDFLSFKQFFTAVGVKSSLITLDTPKEFYQKGGVNISDNSQLLLARNRSDIQRDSFAYLDENKNKRTLIIDEVDKFKDGRSTSYNYATQSQRLKNLVWIYPYLVKFVGEKLTELGNKEFIPAEIIDDFVQYHGIHDTNIAHRAVIGNLKQKSPDQLEIWLRSAHTALEMKADQQYKLTPNDEDKLIAVRDHEGHTRYTRQILVLDNGRPVPGSTFSDGVHQCIAAKENDLAGREDFVILPENETQRASFPVSFINNYENVYGLSGTTLSDAPLSDKSGKINYEGYDYIIVPREKALIRKDKNTWAAKDETQQVEFLARLILKALKKNRPVLILAKDDETSKRLYDALNKNPAILKLTQKWQHVHALTSKNDEIEAIKQAGKPGVVTFSTEGMLGRGVDINSPYLELLDTQISSFADEKQIQGRTARAGKKGKYRKIINLSDKDYQLDGNTYNINNEVDKVQKSISFNQVVQNELSKLYATFLEDITQQFLKDIAPQENHIFLQTLEKWQTFLNAMQHDWDNNKESLLGQLEQNDNEGFKNLFKQFTEHWTLEAPIDSSLKRIDSNLLGIASKVYDSVKAQQTFFEPERKEIKSQKKYDLADDGQARIYSTLFAQTRAGLTLKRGLFANSRAWIDGRGALFPELKATLKGDRPLFANLRATIGRWIKEIKACLSNDDDDDDVPKDSPGVGG